MPDIPPEAKKRRGRPPLHAQQWRNLAYERVAEGIGDTAIVREIEGRVDRPADAPSLRTVQRWRTAFGRLNPSEREGFGIARFPESFTGEALGWEDAPALAELLRWWDRANWRGEVTRPTVGFVQTFARMGKAAPGAPIAVREALARLLTTLSGRPSSPAVLRLIEWAITFRPWEYQPGEAVIRERERSLVRWLGTAGAEALYAAAIAFHESLATVPGNERYRRLESDIENAFQLGTGWYISLATGIVQEEEE